MRWRGLVATLLHVSIASAAPPKVATFNVLHCSASLSPETNVRERPGNLQVELPLFQANATVECDVPQGETWTIGFVQAVDRSDGMQTYAQARTEWVYPGFPLSDCIDNPPFTGRNEQVSRVEHDGPRTVSVYTDDRPLRWTPWDDPGHSDGACDLRSLEWDFRATTWLVARKTSDGSMLVLRKCTWGAHVRSRIDCALPIGLRAETTTGLTPPRAMDVTGESIPPSCLQAPGYNVVQELWRIDSGGRRTRLKT
jgi:hypothetical protein